MERRGSSDDSDQYDWWDCDTSTDSESSDSTQSVCDVNEAWDWYRIDCENSPSPQARFDFSCVPGLMFSVDDPSDPLKFFLHFFDDNVLDLIVNETNKNAASFFLSNELARVSRVRCWRELDKSELLSFLSLLILQGIQQKPVGRMYWSRSAVLETPFFNKTMPERKFGLIMKFLNVSGESQASDSLPHRLRNVNSFVQMLTSKFTSSYVMEQEISVEESIAFKHSTLRKQYGPVERGLRVFYLCESSSGYVANVLVCAGRRTESNEKYTKCKMPTKIVMSLVDGYLGKGYCLTLDTFFTSPGLADILIQNKTDVYGILNPNQNDVPWELRGERLKKGELIGFLKGRVTLLKWQMSKRRSVCMLSSVHSVQMCKEEKNGNFLRKPLAFIDYDRTTRRNDKMDQCLVNHFAKRNEQSRRYCKRLFRLMLDLVVWNSFVLYSKCGGTLDHLDFRVRLVERLSEEYGRKPHGNLSGPRHVKCPLRFSAGHFPSVIPKTGQKLNPTRRCVVCSDKVNELGKRVRRETRYFCEQCDVGLCVAPCFGIYHTKQ